jgi:hypothetical protein
MRRHQQRLVEASLPSQPRTEHVRAVGKRLDAVEHTRGGIGDDAQPHASGHDGGLLGEQQSPPAARHDDAQDTVELGAAARRQQLGDLGLEVRAEHLR